MAFSWFRENEKLFANERKLQSATPVINMEIRQRYDRSAGRPHLR